MKIKVHKVHLAAANLYAGSAMMDCAYSTRKLEFQRSPISAKQKQMIRQMKKTKSDDKTTELEEEAK